MEKFTVRQLRDKYREFFESKGHTRIRLHYPGE